MQDFIIGNLTMNGVYKLKVNHPNPIFKTIKQSSKADQPDSN